jgi:hypothetical protein
MPYHEPIVRSALRALVDALLSSTSGLFSPSGTSVLTAGWLSAAQNYFQRLLPTFDTCSGMERHRIAHVFMFHSSGVSI